MGAAAQRREALAKLLLSKQGGSAEEASRRRAKLGAPSPHGGGKIVYRWARSTVCWQAGAWTSLPVGAPLACPSGLIAQR